MSRNGTRFKTEKHKTPVIILTWRGVFWILSGAIALAGGTIWAAHYLLTSR
jgi:hypothetical protein